MAAGVLKRLYTLGYCKHTLESVTYYIALCLGKSVNSLLVCIKNNDFVKALMHTCCHILRNSRFYHCNIFEKQK